MQYNINGLNPAYQRLNPFKIDRFKTKKPPQENEEAFSKKIFKNLTRRGVHI